MRARRQETAETQRSFGRGQGRESMTEPNLDEHHAPAQTALPSTIAVLVPAHNEEANIGACLAAATAEAGRSHVYVVSDSSTDATDEIAQLYTRNVCAVQRGGKAKAIAAGLERFQLATRYRAVLVVDADSLLSEGALAYYRERLKPGVAAVVGRLRVLDHQGGPIAAWRRHQYLVMARIYLAAAAYLRGAFPVTPGFCTAYATDALRQFEHDQHAPTEDIDFCWQIHRRRLGRIEYAIDAPVETGVPVTMGDYLRQNLRWARGWHYAMRKRRVPLGRQGADFVAGAMTAEMIFVWLRALLLIPLGILGVAFAKVVALSFVVDAALLLALGLAGSLRHPTNLAWLAVFPAMFLLDQAINAYAAVRLSAVSAVWQSPKRG